MAFNFSRYINRNIIRNNSAKYVEQFSSRGVGFIDHFATANIQYPSQKLLKELNIENEIWTVGSRFYKLAAKHYGDPTLWWIIPWFNKLPLESDYDAGEVVLIPKPLSIILNLFETEPEE